MCRPFIDPSLYQVSALRMGSLWYLVSISPTHSYVVSLVDCMEAIQSALISSSGGIALSVGINLMCLWEGVSLDFLHCRFGLEVLICLFLIIIQPYRNEKKFFIHLTLNSLFNLEFLFLKRASLSVKRKI